MSPDRDDLSPTEAATPSAPSSAHGRFIPGTVTIGLVGIAAATTLLLLAMRMGLLATVSAWMTNFLFVLITPLTLDFSRWYAWRTVAIAALLLAIATWSFRAAMGRHKILTAAMFEG